MSVQSVERSFVLLEALAGSDRPLGVSELRTTSGLSLATVHRLLQTLVTLGYVRQESSRGYALGPAFIRLGERAAAGVASWCRPLLAQVAQEVGESVNLATLEDDHVVYIAHVPAARSMRMFTEVGSRVPARSTGVGKAMLARLARTGTESAATLAALDEVTRRGYALDEEEQEAGVRCVAVAVPGTGPLLAVSVSGPTSRMSDDLVARAVPLLRDVAERIAMEMRRA